MPGIYRTHTKNTPYQFATPCDSPVPHPAPFPSFLFFVPYDQVHLRRGVIDRVYQVGHVRSQSFIVSHGLIEPRLYRLE